MVRGAQHAKTAGIAAKQSGVHPISAQHTRCYAPFARNGNDGPVSGEQGTDGDNDVDAFICGLFG